VPAAPGAPQAPCTTVTGDLPHPGEKLCTFNGKYHLAWSVPMADPSYFMPSAQIHAFMMFAPFLAMWEKRGMLIQGTFLLLTGPVMAAAITPNLMEQASIWCFFSIMQARYIYIYIYM
jgi:hypothetical protein